MVVQDRVSLEQEQYFITRTKLAEQWFDSEYSEKNLFNFVLKQILTKVLRNLCETQISYSVGNGELYIPYRPYLRAWEYLKENDSLLFVEEVNRITNLFLRCTVEFLSWQYNDLDLDRDPSVLVLWWEYHFHPDNLYDH